MLLYYCLPWYYQIIYMYVFFSPSQLHHGSSIDNCSLSPSSASGPPLSHRIGSRE